MNQFCNTPLVIPCDVSRERGAAQAAIASQRVQALLEIRSEHWSGFTSSPDGCFYFILFF